MLWWLQDGREALYYIFTINTGGGDTLTDHSGSLLRGEYELVEVLGASVGVEELQGAVNSKLRSFKKKHGWSKQISPG